MDASFHIKPFAFDRVFAASSERRTRMSDFDLQMEADALRTELEVLRRDRDADLARARADGFQAGLVQARSERETALLAAVDALHASVEAMEEEFSKETSRVTREATEVALAAADLIAGRALEQSPEASIDEAIGRVLDQIGRGPRLLIRVAPDLAEEIERIVELRTSRERRKMALTVVPDAAVRPGDALILWEEGGLVLDANARRTAVLEELKPLLEG